MMLVIVDIRKTFYDTLLIIKSKTSIFSQTTIKEDCVFKFAIVHSATETRDVISKKYFFFLLLFAEGSQLSSN